MNVLFENFPCLIVSGDGVQYGGEFSHGSDERDEFWLALLDESVVETLDGWVVCFCDDGWHVESVSDLRSSSSGGSLSSKRSAVSVGGRDTNESCNLLSIELSEFGQF